MGITEEVTQTDRLTDNGPIKSGCGIQRRNCDIHDTTLLRRGADINLFGLLYKPFPHLNTATNHSLSHAFTIS